MGGRCDPQHVSQWVDNNGLHFAVLALHRRQVEPSRQTHTTMAFGVGFVRCAHICGDSSTDQRCVSMDLPLLHCWVCNGILSAFGQGNLQEF
eukprot:2518698-Amphidinium_carterae.1